MKEIPGFSRYFATEDGSLYSKDYKRTGLTKVIKPAKDANGYLRTMLLSDNGKYCTVKVHRIVALAYFGQSDLTVNHKNGIKSDNSVSNLEYCTRGENIKHAYRVLKRQSSMREGAENRNAKLTASQVLEIRKWAKDHGRYYGRNELAKKYGVSPAHIKDIVNNKQLWKSA